ncbi:hypothetical protein JXA32_12985 [Candidatus Sumerlaeota bacterium]|nr:hypothetical protein [Candidatus Sumerlaeota bacterium]
MMKKMRGIAAGAALLAILALSSGVANANSYDRDDSDNPIRWFAYPVHAVGILLEYSISRPIHWIVSQNNCDIIFGHDVQDDEEPAFEWK